MSFYHTCNITSIFYNHHTDIYPLSSLKYIIYLQLQAWGFEDSATPHQLVLTGAANCLWFLVLASQVHTILTQHVLLTRQFIMKLRDKKLEEEKFMF